MTAILFDLHEGVATLTLNQPERLNPLSPAVVQGLLEAMDRVREDSAVRAVLLTGSGRGFCAGADLADLAQRDTSDESLGRQVGRLMEEGGNRVIAGLRELPVPVVCAVNGAAAGGGAGLALAGDVTIAARSAIFYLPFAPALGLVPDMGSSWVLPRRVGRARALGLALLGDKLPAERAAQWGLIWDCVDDAALPGKAREIAGRLAKLPAHAVTEVRALFEAAEHNDLRQQLVAEMQRQQELIDRPCFREGLAAFHERRAPVFPPRTQ
jgi:2-(1,2-epoxy-1,2-dihydrophenyl)acetyl-CoA isomerase